MNIQKGNINKNYGKDFGENKEILSGIKLFIDEVMSVAKDLNKESFCEISHYFSPAFKIMIPQFKKGYFISDNPFEALLTYHFSVMEKMDLKVYNHLFVPDNLLELKFDETFDFVYSYFGLSYEKLYSILPDLISFIKLNGILAVEMPSYWFFRENMNEAEKNILDYSKQNDKKWLFTEPVEPIITECGAELISLKKLTEKKIINRFDLSYISSLHKLHKAQIENNIAILEVANIPEKNIEIGSALLIIRKKNKTITKDNLFKF